MLSMLSGRDLCGCFSTDLSVEQNAARAAVFLGRLPGDTEAGRVMLYVCPECGDLNCGALTFALSRDDGTFIWRDFAIENGYAVEMTDWDSFSHIGPFVFEAQAYCEAIEKARSL